MRTIILIASIFMIGAGVFCVANSSAAFLSVAFVVGLVMMAIGISEIFIGRRADFKRDDTSLNLTKDGFRSIIVGLVIISGQITDDTMAVMFFGLYLAVEGVAAFKFAWIDISHAARDQRIHVTISAFLLFFGIYMMFNNAAFRLPVIMLVGIGLIVLGLNRFIQSFSIEYDRPSFITGNEEKLLEAQEDEKRALAKAKEGIREQKAAQRRIKKIEDDIAAEHELVKEAQFRKLESEAEKTVQENQ